MDQATEPTETSVDLWTIRVWVLPSRPAEPAPVRRSVNAISKVNLSIRMKLLATAGLLLLLMGVVGALSVVSLGSVTGNAQVA
jgi:hypothetical protein